MNPQALFSSQSSFILLGAAGFVFIVLLLFLIHKIWQRRAPGQPASNFLHERTRKQPEHSMFNASIPNYPNHRFSGRPAIAAKPKPKTLSTKQYHIKKLHRLSKKGTRKYMADLKNKQDRHHAEQPDMPNSLPSHADRRSRIFNRLRDL
ncbi:hypothetical protein GF323_02015 [Candidatus Woesearchaeota archaeon]|nr:hypothetical protein [Candidatus Woesearchaeota archaeon]